MKKKRITTRVCFFQETSKDTSECVQHFDIVVPEDVREEHIYDCIRQVHRRLTEEDKGEDYKENGLIPRYLLEIVCDENGWELDEIDYGINISFNVSDTTKYCEETLE